MGHKISNEKSRAVCSFAESTGFGRAAGQRLRLLYNARLIKVLSSGGYMSYPCCYRWALATVGACGSLRTQPIFSTFSSGPIRDLFAV